jgi:hypothetical protein
MSLQISIFGILSFVLACFFGFSANSFLRFHFVFQKTVLFRTLLITYIYQLIGKDILVLKIIENNTKQPGLDCLSFFLDILSAMPRISLSRRFIPLYANFQSCKFLCNFNIIFAIRNKFCK